MGLLYNYGKKPFGQKTQPQVNPIPTPLSETPQIPIIQEETPKPFNAPFRDALGKTTQALKSGIISVTDPMIKGFEPKKEWSKMNILEKSEAVRKEAMDKVVPDDLVKSVAQWVGAAGGVLELSDNISPTKKVLEKFGVAKENPVAEYLMNSQTSFMNRYQQDLTPKTYNAKDNFFTNPGLLLNPEFLVDAVSSQLPHLVAAYFTAGLSEGIFEAGSFKQERFEKNLANKKPSELKDDLTALGVGLVNGILGKIGFDSILGRNPALKKAIASRITSRIGRYVANVVGSVAIEDMMEFIQEGVPLIATKVVYDEGGTWKEVGKEAVSSGLAAASQATIMGSAAAVITGGGSGITDMNVTIDERQNELKMTPEQRESLNNILKNLPKETAEKVPTFLGETISNVDIAKLGETEKGLMTTVLQAIQQDAIVYQGQAYENIAANIKALSSKETTTETPTVPQTPEAKTPVIQPTQTVTPEIKAPPITEITDQNQAEIADRLAQLDTEMNRANEQGKLVVQKEMDDLENKISDHLRRTSTMVLDVSKDKPKEGLQLAVKKGSEGKYGFGGYIPAIKAFIPFNYKFTNQQEATKAGLRSIIRSVEQARLSGIPESKLVPIRNIILAKQKEVLGPKAKEVTKKVVVEERKKAKTKKPVAEKPKQPATEKPKQESKKYLGWKDFSEQLEKMVKEKTIFPEEKILLEEVFKNAPPEMMEKLQIKSSGQLKHSGKMTKFYHSGKAIVKIRKGLAEEMKEGEYFFKPDTLPSVVVLHEMGHLGWFNVLSNEEKALVEKIYQEKKRGLKEHFQQGMSAEKEYSAKYFSKNSQEFFAQSFAEYVMENKVPDAQMKPLLERMYDMLKKALENLVNRREKFPEFAPLFDKILGEEKKAVEEKPVEKKTPISPAGKKSQQEKKPMTKTAAPTAKTVPSEKTNDELFKPKVIDGKTGKERYAIYTPDPETKNIINIFNKMIQTDNPDINRFITQLEAEMRGEAQPDLLYEAGLSKQEVKDSEYLLENVMADELKEKEISYPGIDHDIFLSELPSLNENEVDERYYESSEDTITRIKIANLIRSKLISFGIIDVNKNQLNLFEITPEIKKTLSASEIIKSDKSFTEKSKELSKFFNSEGLLLYKDLVKMNFLENGKINEVEASKFLSILGEMIERDGMKMGKIDSQLVVQSINAYHGVVPGKGQYTGTNPFEESDDYQKNYQAAYTGATPMASYEQITDGSTKLEYDGMKLYSEVIKLIHKYARTIGQSYQTPGSEGTYYGQTGNIMINGLNNLSVATHEITHSLDTQKNTTKRLMEETKTGDKLRKRMTDLYVKYYPGGKRNHPLRLRMREAMATLLQKYVEAPQTITAEFPELVATFFTEGGQYYDPIYTSIINDLRKIIKDYQSFASLDKVATRMVTEKVNVEGKSFMTGYDKVIEEATDNVYPIEKIAEMGKVANTTLDPSLWIRQFQGITALISNNIVGKKGYWRYINGAFQKISNQNWETLITKLKTDKMFDEFGAFLIARNQVLTFLEYDETTAKIENWQRIIEEMGGIENFSQQVGAKKDLIEMQKDKENYKRLSGIIRKDGFSREEVMIAFKENKDRFAEYSELFDKLSRYDIDMLSDEFVQLINPKRAAQLRSRKGYASVKRAFYNEIVGEQDFPEQLKRGAMGISSLNQRRGSSKPIIHPVYSAILFHSEATKKAHKQIVYNTLGRLSRTFPDYFQELSLIKYRDIQKQKTSYPQSKDPNIIMARRDYKQVPLLVNNELHTVVEEILNPGNVGYFEQILLKVSRFFTKGTTALWLPFTLSNAIIDQVTAVAQTQNNFVPVYSPLKLLYEYATDDTNNKTNQYFQEYLILAGERQTFAGMIDMSPTELSQKIRGERDGLLKVLDMLNKGIDIFSIPSKYSEIMTRATEYIKARQANKPVIVALEEAGRVTAPFHHIGRLGSGSFGKSWVKSVAFFNPAIQVLAQAQKTLQTPRGRKRYAITVAAVTAASIAALASLSAAGSDEQKRLYAGLTPEELAMYIYFPHPFNKKKLARLKVSPTFATIGTIANMAIAEKILETNYSPREYVDAIMQIFPAQLNVTDPLKMTVSLIPQAIKTGGLVALGMKDFPKIMPIESEYMKYVPEAMRFNQGTSGFAKWAGKTFNLSPLKIDALLTGYFGRSIGYVTQKPNITDIASAVTREEYFTSSRQLSQFYDMKKENDAKYNSFKSDYMNYSSEEKAQIIRDRAAHREIEKYIDMFRDIDEKKDPITANYYKNIIVKKINDLTK